MAYKNLLEDLASNFFILGHPVLPNARREWSVVSVNGHRRPSEAISQHHPRDPLQDTLHRNTPGQQLDADTTEIQGTLILVGNYESL